MKGSTLSFFLCALGCLGEACTETPRTAERPAAGRLMLHEPFAVGSATCRVIGTREHVTEPRSDTSRRRVQPDVRAIAVSLRCEDGAGRPLNTQQALPKDWVILLFSAVGERIAPSNRTFLSDELPEELIFEIAHDDPVVARTRRYDAASGLRTTQVDKSFGHLALSGSGVNHVVELRPRSLTVGFEQALDRLIEELTSQVSAASPNEPARRLHRNILQRSGARTFTALPSFATATSGTLILGYAPASRRAPHVTTLALRWSYDLSTMRLHVDQVENEQEVDRSLTCARDVERLEVEARLAYASGPTGEDCHVLGLLLPGPCGATDPALLSRALRVLARCVGPAVLRTQADVPRDFQLTLRRGRTGSPLDRSPRYLVSLFAAGEVVLHGKHWVNQLGRSDGRTAPSVLAGLYAHMKKLDWFDRKGGEWSAEACSVELEERQVVTLHADGRERMILDHDGCRGPFSTRELDEVRQLVEAAIGIDSYTRERPEYADQNARVWTVE